VGFSGYSFWRLCEHPEKKPLVTACAETRKGSLRSLKRIPYLQTGGFSLGSALTVEALMQNAGKQANPLNHSLQQVRFPSLPARKNIPQVTVPSLREEHLL